MTDTTQGAPAPKKRSLFKRAAWQDAPKTEGEDIFSHASEFKNIVAEQNRLQAEKRRQAQDEERKRKHAGHADSKRRKVSNDYVDHDNNNDTVVAGSGSSSSVRPGRRGSKARRSRTPLSPSRPPPESLSARYEALTKSASSHGPSRDEPVVIDLSDSDDGRNSDNDVELLPDRNERAHVTTMRSSRQVPAEDDDGLEEVLDPTLAVLAARARERAANRALAAATTSVNGEPAKAPVAQLFISPEIPDSKPLMVKVRIDSTLEKTRLAWCAKQGFSPDMTKDVYFTWKDTRVYDSTTVKRLGIQVDANGNVSVDGDSNMYDDVNLPKVYVQAWTDALFQQHMKDEAAAAAARKKAAEPPPLFEPRSPTPEPAPQVKKIRLIMKAKGKEDFKLFVNPESTFGHIADAYKQRRDIEPAQPITLMFDGERLVPMDTIAESEVEDMDSLDVLFK